MQEAVGDGDVVGNGGNGEDEVGDGVVVVQSDCVSLQEPSGHLIGRLDGQPFVVVGVIFSTHDFLSALGTVPGKHLHFLLMVSNTPFTGHLDLHPPVVLSRVSPKSGSQSGKQLSDFISFV